MDFSQYITKSGMDQIQRRIQYLMNDERPEVIKAVSIAREYGDLSENAEYKAAKERQRAIDTEIDHLRRRSAHLKVVDPDAFPRDSVRFGLFCHTKDCDTGEEQWFHIVGVDEINFPEAEGVMAVSVASPIGKGLLGKKLHEIACIHAPMGMRKLEVLEIK
ncbi:MAG: transcription elongation factor GreA [Candidatus Cloacimonetes bacterium]|nr:transcription elongation factor GreA [Candidatus Cloacimonadota bacterium]